MYNTLPDFVYYRYSPNDTRPSIFIYRYYHTNGHVRSDEVILTIPAEVMVEQGAEGMLRAPTAYRHFMAQGVLTAVGEAFNCFELCHADDLPAGEAAKTVLAERVRQRKSAHVFGHADAIRESVTVEDFSPPDAMWYGDLFAR